MRSHVVASGSFADAFVVVVEVDNGVIVKVVVDVVAVDVVAVARRVRINQEFSWFEKHLNDFS